ncbi:hypothetical protein ACOSP7_023851 [Xanthoceras sorbifolium]
MLMALHYCTRSGAEVENVVLSAEKVEAISSLTAHLDKFVRGRDEVENKLVSVEIQRQELLDEIEAYEATIEGAKVEP